MGSQTPLQNRHNKLTSSFGSGMVQDIAYSKFPKGAYWEAKNFRFYSKENRASGILSTPKGNEITVSFTAASVNEILYFVEGNDSIFFFIRHSTSFLVIYRILKSNLNTTTTVSSFISYSEITGRGFVINLNLGYDSDTTISQAIYNYETEEVQKLYWVDDKFRHLNIVNNDNNVLSELSVADLNTYSKAITDKISFSGYINGNLKYGTYFYTYQLYNVNGLETSYAPLSDPIFVYNNPLSGDYKKVLIGRVGDDSNVGVKGIVSPEEYDKFDKIRIVSVYYASKETTPIVSIIEEKDIPGADIYFTDVGTTINNLTVEDLVFRNVPITPSTLLTKDNYLFVGNVSKENYFDMDEWMQEQGYTFPGVMGIVQDEDDDIFWEARSFPLDSTNQVRLTTGVGKTSSVSKTLIWNSSAGAMYVQGTTKAVSKTHDCMTRANGDIELNPKDNSGSPYYCGYKTFDGFPGGQGTNISYVYTYDDIILNIIENGTSIDNLQDDYTDPEYTSSGKFSDYSNPENVATLSLAHDEFYRVGIQFIEKSTGRLSYVKWIGDLRTPMPNDITSGTNPIIKGSGTTIKAYPLKAVFYVKNVPSELAWRIVEVPKESDFDYSEIASGVTQTFTNAGGSNRVVSQPILTGDVTNPYLFISPDINYGNVEIKSGDIIKYMGAYSGVSNGLHYPEGSGGTYKTETFAYYSSSYFKELESVALPSAYLTIDAAKKLTSERVKDVEGNRNFDITVGSQSNLTGTVVFYDGSTVYQDERGILGTSYIIETDSALDSSKYYYMSIKRENVQSRFGGYTYEDRSYNIYVPATAFIDGDGTNTTTVDLYGDYFLGIYEHLMSYPIDSTYSMKTTWFIPAWSRYNFILQNKYCSSKRTYRERITYPEILITESVGVYDIEDGGDLHILTQEYPFYEHNTAYDVLNSMDYQLPKVDNTSIENTSYSTTIQHSDKKLVGEYTDSYLKFINNKTLTLDLNLGELVQLVKFKDSIYFFQERGFGIIYSEERHSSVQNNSSITIARGTVLEGSATIDYIHGISNKKHIAISNDYLYWISSNTKSLIVFDGQRTTDLGIITGMSSYFEALSDSVIGNIKLGFDHNYKELYINFYNTADDTYYSLIYNENYKKFVGLFNSTELVELNTINNNLCQITDKKLYLANQGNFNYFFESYEDSSITLVINPYETVEFIYEFFELLVDVISASTGSPIDYTIDNIIESITISNSYQESTLDVSKLKKRFRKIRGNIIRDDTTRDRIKDYYTKVTITFSNELPGRAQRPLLLLNDIISYFTIQVI